MGELVLTLGFRASTRTDQNLDGGNENDLEIILICNKKMLEIQKDHSLLDDGGKILKNGVSLLYIYNIPNI